MARTNTVSVNNLGGGVNDLYLLHEIAPSESPNTLRNVRLEGNSKKPRKGYTTFADELTGGTDIKGMAAYRRDAVANDRLVINYNATLYSIDPSSATTWTTITDTITLDSRMYFANYRDWLFCFNGVDEPGRLEGTTYSEPFTKPDSIGSTALFLPAFGEVSLGRLWVSGIPTAPNGVFISNPGTIDAPENIYDFSGTLDDGGPSELILQDRVTAVKKMATLVVMFTVSGAAYVDGFKDLGSSVVPNAFPIGGASGAVNQGSTVVVENDIFYLTPQKEIKSIRRGFADSISVLVNPLSLKINKFLKENLDDDQSQAYGYYDEKNKLYKLYVKSQGASFNDLCIVGDISELDQNGVPPWTIDDARQFSCAVYYNDQGYLGSDVIGQVYKDENGFADDDDAPINSKFSSKDFIANNPTILKRYNNLTIYGQITTSTSISATVYVDGIETETVTIDSNDIGDDALGGIGVFPIGEQAIGDDDLEEGQLKEFVKRIPFRKTGKRIRIDFETNDTNQNYIISHIDYSFVALSKLYAPIGEML